MTGRRGFTQDGGIVRKGTSKPVRPKARLPRDLRATAWPLGSDTVILSYSLEEASISASAAGLTRAEHAIAELVLSGGSNAAIAAERGIAQATVAKHLERIYRKCGVTSRGELAAKYARKR